MHLVMFVIKPDDKNEAISDFILLSLVKWANLNYQDDLDH